MPWFAIDTDLEGNAKVHALARARGWTIERTIVFLYRFLSSVRLYAADGDVTRWDDRMLGRLTSVAHQGLMADLAQIGFLDGRGQSLLVHDWHNRNGRWIKDSKWQRRNRNELAGKGLHFDATPTTPSRARAVEHEHEQEPKEQDLVQRAGQNGSHITGRKPAAARPEPDPVGFDAFFKAYPRRDGRRAAAREFAHAIRRHPDLSHEDVTWAAAMYARQLAKDPKHEDRFTPMPRTWLSQDRFLEFFDEVPDGDKA